MIDENAVFDDRGSMEAMKNNTILTPLCPPAAATESSAGGNAKLAPPFCGPSQGELHVRPSIRSPFPSRWSRYCSTIPALIFESAQ